MSELLSLALLAPLLAACMKPPTCSSACIDRPAVKLGFSPRLKPEPKESATWDSHDHIAGNCLLKNSVGETIVLYYAALPYPKTAVGLARTKDHATFVKHAEPVLTSGPAGSWDAGGVSVFPGCITQRHDGTYWLYYSGISAGASDFYREKHGAIGVAVSSDLVHWEKREENPILRPGNSGAWDDAGVFEPSVIFTGDEYGGPGAFKMWYGGTAQSGEFAIGYAESINGVSWTKSSLNPVLKRSTDPNAFDAFAVEVHHVVRAANRYVMVYEAVERKFPARFAIGLATSRDGLRWERHASSPLLEAGPVGAWDAMGAYHPAILIEPDKVLLYYVGLDFAYRHQVGVASINPALIFSPLQ